MFKVICIRSMDNKCVNSNRVVSVPKIGDIDVVVKVVRRIHYILERFNSDVGYPSENFGRLSNIDEKELLEERELQFQNA